MVDSHKHRVAIVGGGFAGIGAARALRDDHHVTLIDQRPYFEFRPNIHEIVSGLKKPGTVRLSLERIARNLQQTFVQDHVKAIDPKAKMVLTSSQRIPYDALILAPGGRPSSDRVAGVETHGHCFASAEDAEWTADRLRIVAGLPGRHTVTIVGGGFTGVEVLGEILRKYRNERRLRLRLIESGGRLMRDWPKVLHQRVKKIAENHDVEVLLDTRVAEVDRDRITLTTGQALPSQLTIWTAGSRAPGFVESAGFAIGPSGWAEVDDTLASGQFPGVFIAGDAAQLPKRVRKQGAEALRLGERAAKNVNRLLKGRALKSFRKENLPLLITFGDLSAFVLLEDDTVIEGQALAAGREFTFQQSMAVIDDLSRRRSLERLAKRMRVSEEKLGWTRSLSPFNALDQLLGIRVHLGS
jgi:NADH dehydrogenase